MKRSARIAGLGALAALVALPAGNGPASAAGQHVLKLTTLAPKGSSYHRALQRMGEGWRDASGGSVELVIYAGGIQGGEAAMVERMRINQAQAAMLTAIGLNEIETAVSGLQNMPMMFRSLEEVDHVGEKLHPLLEQRLRDKGFVVLFWADAGWVFFFSDVPVLRFQDLQKLKLFAWAGDMQGTEIMNDAGLNPVLLETADILTGLKTGLIDAAPLPPFYALATQVYGPAPHMLDLEWGPLVGALVVTRGAWEKIPPDLRGKLAAIATETGKGVQSTGRRESVESVRTMQEKWGLEVHTPTPEMVAGWRKASEAAYPEIRGKVVPEEVFDEVSRLLRAYREARGDPP
jgi:TRAP-type C4-dicarboxylate transport system substrate-binding protein